MRDELLWGDRARKVARTTERKDKKVGREDAGIYCSCECVMSETKDTVFRVIKMN